METASIIAIFKESIFMVVVFVGFLLYTIAVGRQSITNLILGLYFALLISVEFPYYDVLFSGTESKKVESVAMLVLFSILTVVFTILFARLMPREYLEGKFEDFWKKVLLACAGTALVMAFSYHALPVTEIITPGSPIAYLFGSESSFFWWLVAPIIVLFLT
ncbi:MAG: hypothetical protein RJA61_79 [Candidatus Parcubacteria bacterium]|jgi:signal transduction histidine kinase